MPGSPPRWPASWRLAPLTWATPRCGATTSRAPPASRRSPTSPAVRRTPTSASASSRSTGSPRRGSPTIWSGSASIRRDCGWASDRVASGPHSRRCVRPWPSCASCCRTLGSSSARCSTRCAAWAAHSLTVCCSTGCHHPTLRKPRAGSRRAQRRQRGRHPRPRCTCGSPWGRARKSGCTRRRLATAGSPPPTSPRWTRPSGRSGWPGRTGRGSPISWRPTSRRSTSPVVRVLSERSLASLVAVADAAAPMR